LFYQIYKSNWSYSETLVHRSRTIVDFELSKPDHVINAFESINESKNCFEITYVEDLNLENQFVYKYKKSKSKKTLNENEKEIIGHKIILKYPKKLSVKEGDPTYWSVYSDLNLLQYLIQLSIEVGEVSSLTLKQIFERIVSFKMKLSCETCATELNHLEIFISELCKSTLLTYTFP